MRITNTMITSNTKSNINSNKLLVDKYNTQMTTQKKIAKASEDPVIAIRSLRLATNMSHINQYINNNIPDASAWMGVTETALTNMEKLLNDVRTQCVNGSTDSKNAGDRETILEALKSLSEQVYSEGNADYAGKTVFTGYRSSSNLTFDKGEVDTTYEIDQSFDYSDLEEKRYYTGDVGVPTPEMISANEECDTVVAQNSYERIRLAYNGDTTLNEFKMAYTDADGNAQEITITREEVQNGDEVSIIYTSDSANGAAAPVFNVYESEEQWEEAKQDEGELGKVAGIKDENGEEITPEIIYIEATGEFIFSKNMANTISDGKAEISVNYTKKGFDKGELRPEYYYDCRDITDDDASKHVTYTKEDQPINYEIANNTYITINTQADKVFDTAIARDIDEMINIVQKALTAADKVTQIEEMMAEAQYSDKASQEILQGYLDAAKKEADFADDNLQKTYEHYITRFNGYMETVNTALTNIGSLKNSLTLTQTRVENQKTTIEELQSQNEDRDISDVIIDYYAAYNAYTSSLTAAGKVGERTLLDYI